MASRGVDSATIQRTKDTMGKVIKKPALTDKLLSRPPFRYLHDIVTEIMRSTGFFKGLYTAQELDAKSIQDRESKLTFLQKAIDTLSFTRGELVRVKPSKVVAGQEAEKTNEFLQILAITIIKKLDSTEAVQRVLNGEKPSETLGKDKKKRRGEGKEKEKGGREENDVKRSRSKERGGGGERQSSGGAQKQQTDSSARTRPTKEGGEAVSNKSDLQSGSDQLQRSGSGGSAEGRERPRHRPSRRRPPPESTGDSAPLQNHVGSEEGRGNEDEDLVGSETRLDRPISAKGQRTRPPPPPSQHPPVTTTGEEEATEPMPTVSGEQSHGYHGNPPEGHDDVITESHDSHTTANRSPSPPPTGIVASARRPSTARPAPPKIVKHSSSVEDLDSRIPSGHKAAPPTVIIDRPGEAEEEEEEDGQFMVEDSAHVAPPTTDSFLEGASNKPEGMLTRTIVATKERLEGSLPPSEVTAHPGISEAQRRKERELVAKEIERLQSSIQTLCRSANPLGKIMDYVQEDMDSMQKELETWRVENERHTEALRKEESITEQELSPLRRQLEELETRIREQVDLISATKANILRNDEKIQQMLNSMAFSST